MADDKKLVLLLDPRTAALVQQWGMELRSAMLEKLVELMAETPEMPDRRLATAVALATGQACGGLVGIMLGDPAYRPPQIDPERVRLVMLGVIASAVEAGFGAGLETGTRQHAENVRELEKRGALEEQIVETVKRRAN